MNKLLRQMAHLMIPLMLLPTAAQAANWDNGKGQVHGFLSQGLVTSTNNNWYGKSSEHVSFDFSELGLNGSYRAAPGIQLSAQLMSRHAGKMDTGKLTVDYAFADITLLRDEDKTLGVRLGRMKNPFGLYNETRDVAFTRPGAILPQPIYFDRSRKFLLSGDGIHIYGNVEVPGGSLDATLALVKMPINDRGSKSILVGPGAKGNLESGRISPTLHVLYETDDKRWRGGLTYLTINPKYHPAPGDSSPPVSVLLEPWIISLQYTGEKWALTGEYSQRNTEFIQGGVRTTDEIAENWYVQGQYHFMPQWELMLRYDSAARNRDDPNGKQFAASTGGISYTRYARDWVMGVRHDVTSNFMVRAELHHITGTLWLSPLDNPSPANLERDWNMLMLLGSWHF